MNLDSSEPMSLVFARRKLHLPVRRQRGGLYRDISLGAMSKVVTAGVLLVFAALLGSLGLYWEIGPVRDGPQDVVADVVQLIAIILGAVSAVRLSGIESRPLSKRVAVAGLAFGLMPYVLLLGVPGYVFNAAFLLVALSSAMAIWRFPGREI
jgi:hypothetical protein